jgi:hypothetical protein
MARAANMGMGARPARTFHAFLNRRNVFDEWGLELCGGWATGDSFIGDGYLLFTVTRKGRTLTGATFLAPAKKVMH